MNRRLFGFITFESEEAAARALAELNGKTVPAEVEVEVAGADRARKPNINNNNRSRQKPASSNGTPAGGLDTNPNNAGGGGRGRRPRRFNRSGPRVNDGTKYPEMNDPNYGKQVFLTPNPIATPPKLSEMKELSAGPRKYRHFRQEPQEGKQVGQLVLDVDVNKGPFMCDFRLGSFELKLLSVRIESKPGDTKVSCRISHPATGQENDVYFRYVDNVPRNKPLALRPKKHVGDETTYVAPTEAFFVTIDSVIVDVNSGLWKKLVFSLVTVPVIKRPATASASTTKPVSSQ